MSELPVVQTSGVARAAGLETAPAPSHWHAHLSAISRPENAKSVPKPVPPTASAQAKRIAGTSLDKSMLGLAVHLQSVSSSTFLTATPGCDITATKNDFAGWEIQGVRDAPGEYNILVAAATNEYKYLSSPREGPDVDLYYKDDGSGRQRWTFQQAGDSVYVITLAGGKQDDKVYLGVRDDGTVRLFAEDKGKQTQWGLSDGCDCTSSTDPPANTSPAANTHVPSQVVPELFKITGLSEQHVDTILQLISLPENSTPRWWTNYNYIEFLGDGRGFTATLFGACSGTGDLAMIFEELSKIKPRSAECDRLLEYLPALKQKRGDDIKGIEPIKKIIKGLGDDDAWQQAVWKVYVKLYWRFAADWADKKGEAASRPGPVLKLPLTRGFMVDTAINHGANFDSFMDIVKRMPQAARSSKDEVAWFQAFADAREKMLKSGYQDLDTSRTGDRCRLWKDLAAQGNTQLRVPFKAYKGYWGTYTVQ